MKAKAVIFDFGGTLFDYYPSNAEIWVKISKLLGLDILPNNPDLLSGLAKQRRYLEYSANSGKELLNTNWDDPYDKNLMKWNNFVSNELKINNKNSHQIIYEEFKKREGSYQIYKESREILDELLRRKIKIGMVSNTSESSAEGRRPMLEEYGILKHFETIIFSSEVGIAKPDHKIFVMALEELQIPAENVLHVGDSIYHDVNGAKKVGITPILYDPLKFFIYDCIKIENLLDLLELIE